MSERIPGAPLQALEAGLARARAHLLRSDLCDALDRGLRLGARFVFLLGVVTLIGSVLRWQGLGLPRPALVLSLPLALLVLLAPAAGLLLGASARRRSLRDTAQRLDLAAGNQNRIAIALEYAPGPAGPFEAAALREGLAALGRAAGIDPSAEVRHGLSGPTAGALAAGLLLLASAAWIPAGPARDPEAVRPGTAVADVRSVPGAREASAPADPGSRPADRDLSRTRDEREPSGGQEVSEARPASTRPGEASEAAGVPGRGRSGETGQTSQSSSGQGQPTEGASPEPSEESRRPRSRTRRPGQTPVKQVGRERQDERNPGATVGQAGSGGGSMAPVSTPWSQRDLAADEPLPENPGDEEVEDEPSEQEARGGTQPMLKDRRAAPSRDLAIGAPGEGGEGRGGPSPQKKSRGTASLVMGVPMPDFVRGLLNPGTTKVTHERVSPRPLPGAARQAVTAGAAGPEPAVRATTVAPGLRLLVLRLLVILHGADRPAP